MEDHHNHFSYYNWFINCTDICIKFCYGFQRKDYLLVMHYKYEQFTFYNLHFTGYFLERLFEETFDIIIFTKFLLILNF